VLGKLCHIYINALAVLCIVAEKTAFYYL